MEPETTEKTNKIKGILKNTWEWIKVITIALLISLPIRYFIIEPFIVNGASMDPTFATGQFLIVDRLTYRIENPSRGDVIVFEYPYKYPDGSNVYYIKRIIGLPKETIKIVDGKIEITRQNSSSTPILLDEPYIKEIHRSHDNMQVTLNDNEYFVMGDNRKESSDSRVWGPLDKSFIIGRPIIRLFPLNTLSILPGEFN